MKTNQRTFASVPIFKNANYSTIDLSMIPSLVRVLLLGVLFLGGFAYAGSRFSDEPLRERPLSEYFSRFPGADRNLYTEQNIPQIPAGRQGGMILAPLKAEIFDLAQQSNLKDDNHFLIVGGSWILFDAPLERAYLTLKSPIQRNYPPPETGATGLFPLDNQHDLFTAFISNGILGINVDQICRGIVSFRKLGASVDHVSQQFEECRQKGQLSNIWVHESLSHQLLLTKNFEGREVTLMLYRNFTIIERHRIGIVMPTKNMILSAATGRASDGLKVIISNVESGFRGHGF